MGFTDWIKGLFGKKDDAAGDEGGIDTAQSSQPGAETAGDVGGGTTATEPAPGAGDTNPPTSSP